MRKRSQVRIAGSFLAVAMSVVLAAGCEEDEKADDSYRKTLNIGRGHLIVGRHGDAERLCMQAEAMRPAAAEPQYCVMLANVGKLTNSISAILGLVATTLGAPPAIRPQAALDLKSIIRAMVSDIEDAMAGIDVYAYKLTLHEDPTFQIESLPLALKIDDLLKLAGETDFKVDPTLKLDLGGTWDKTEVLILGAAVNAAQAALDYVFAHQLKLNSTKFDFSTTQTVAEFLTKNPNLMLPDTQDAGRITGDDERKGLKKDVLAAMSYLVGRESEMEWVTPAHTGLRDAIKLSAQAARPDAILVWVDDDGDGIPEKVGFPAITGLQEAIIGADGKPLISDSEVDNWLTTPTWLAILDFGITMRDNIEKGGKPASITSLLERIVADLRIENTSTRILQKPVPDLIAVNPSAFFKKVKFVNELIPYYFSFTASNNASRRFELAVETEVFQEGTIFTRKIGYVYRTGPDDYPHLQFPSNDGYAETITVYEYRFDNFESTPVPIPADGVSPSAKTPLLWYIALQDPSLGGALEVDAEFQLSDGKGGNYAPPDAAAFNKGLNKLLKYYCIDANDFKLEMFDDTDALYANNRIADCKY